MRSPIVRLPCKRTESVPQLKPTQTSQPKDGGARTVRPRGESQASPRQLHGNGSLALGRLSERSGLLILRGPCRLKLLRRLPQPEIGAGVSARRLLCRDRGQVVPRNPFCKVVG